MADPAPPPAPTVPLSGRRGREWLIRAAVVVAAVVLVILFATSWDRWTGAATRQETDDAYLRSDITPLSAKVEGYVKTVPVDDFQPVKAGDLLVEIDDSDYRAKVAQAEAEVEGAQAAIDNLKARKASQHVVISEAADVITATEAD